MGAKQIWSKITYDTHNQNKRNKGTRKQGREEVQERKRAYLDGDGDQLLAEEIDSVVEEQDVPAQLQIVLARRAEEAQVAQRRQAVEVACKEREKRNTGRCLHTGRHLKQQTPKT